MSACLVCFGRLRPTLIRYSGYSVLTTSFSFTDPPHAFLVSLVISTGCMIVKHCSCFGSVARIMAGPSLVLNFTILCIVDGTAPSLSRSVLPKMMLFSAKCPITTKSTKTVFYRCLSWLVSVRGMWIVPNDHRLCPVNPTNLPIVGLSPSFHLSGMRRKQCS